MGEEDDPVIHNSSSKLFEIIKGWIYYKLDSMLAMRSNQFKLLCFALIFLNVVMAIPWYISGGMYGVRVGDTDWKDSMFDVWSLIMDTGIQYYAVHNSPRFLAAICTIMGLLFAAVLTGFVVDAVMEKMNDLRKGKSAVMEWNHTLLIGWTDRSIAFIAQICLANESDGGGCIVVLSEFPKEDMEAELASTMNERDLRGTRVVFRTGSPLSAMDLRRAACETARSIVIMAAGDTHSKADAATLRVVIALKTFTEMIGHVVVEVLDKEMEHLMKIIGGEQIETLITYETLARMSLSSVKQPGIAVAYEELLGFDGDEFYTATWPHLAGKKFGSCVEYFPMAIAIGVVNNDGSVILNPSNDYPLAMDTGIIVIAEDDDSYEAVTTPYSITSGSLPKMNADVDAPDRLLFIGWTDNVKGMLDILNTIFDPGTEVHLLNRTPVEERLRRLSEQGLDIETHLYNLEVTHIVGDPAVWRTLRTIKLETYRCMLVISDERELGDLMASDSHNLACILLLRHHVELTAVETNRNAEASTGGMLRKEKVRAQEDTKEEVEEVEIKTTPKQPIFCEILDTRTQKLIADHPSLGQSCHFLVSNRLISKVLAMVAEDRKVSKILTILLSGVTSIMLKSSEIYVSPSERVSFFVVAKRAQRLNQICIGYQKKNRLNDIFINPKDKDEPKYWSDCDFIMISRDEKVERNRNRSNRLPDKEGEVGSDLSHPVSQRVKSEETDKFASSQQYVPKTYHKESVADLMGLVATSLAHAAGASISDSTIDVPFSTSKPMGFVVVADNDDVSQSPVVSSVTEGGSASVAGVKDGWVVKAVDGVDITTTSEMVQCLVDAKNSQRKMTIVSFALPVANAVNLLHDPHLDEIEDPVSREVALRLKCAHLQRELGTKGLPEPSAFLEPSTGYQDQVADLHRAVEMERRLRMNTEKMLRETQRAVEDLVEKQRDHDRTIELLREAQAAPPPVPLTLTQQKSLFVSGPPPIPSPPPLTAQPPSAPKAGSPNLPTTPVSAGSGYGQQRRPTLSTSLKIKTNAPPPAVKATRRGRSLGRSPPPG
mmetsp:Transcript_4221/g.5566  ORF Transcript_4221/g.5566 Transcript_4221/m.5566 type:complete len:1055 (-) Transcript_4221:132-3296(-)